MEKKKETVIPSTLQLPLRIKETKPPRKCLIILKSKVLLHNLGRSSMFSHFTNKRNNEVTATYFISQLISSSS